jgi:MFS family permease
MLAVVLSAMFMAQFDFFVVNVATPSISHDLGAGPVALELIVGGYAFTFAAGLITGGRLGDLYGYRRMFLIGMTSFAVASLLCGIAHNVPQLIAARLLQGLTGALMVPQVLALITATHSPCQRPRAMGWFGVASGLGGVLANVLGGMLLDANLLGLSWRPIFLVNIPVAAVAVLCAVRCLPRTSPPRRAQLDPLGALGIAASLALLLIPLSLGNYAGWPTWTWLSIAASAPVGAATLGWQRLLAARGGSPTLQLSLLTVPSYLAGVTACAAFQLYFGSFVFTLTQCLQVGLGLTPFDGGLVFLSCALTFSAGSLACFRLIPRYGLSVVVLGGLVVAAGLLVLALQLVITGPRVSLAGVIIALMLIGVGNGAVLPQLIGASLIDIEPHHAGVGAAVLNTAQQFGNSAGVTLIGAVFFTITGQQPGTGRTGGQAGYTHAMAVSATIDTALILLVSALMAYNKHRAHQDRDTSRAPRG